MIVGLEPYPRMKDSGVEWLGEVPGHWEVIRTRYLFREIDQRSSSGEETHLSMSQSLGLVPSSKVQSTLISESYVGGKLCEQDDLVLNRLKAHLGVFARAKQPGVISPDYSVFRKIRPMETAYFELVLRSPSCRTELRIRAKGIVEGFWRLYTDDFYSIRLPMPSVSEQTAITRFLDHVDQRVQRYVRAKKKLIGLLEEQKQAIIRRAVTRGLDPDVRLKPSGVEWLGEIPEHWDVARLRNVTKSITSGSRGWSSYAADEGPLFIRVANLSRMSLDLRFHDVVRLNLPETSEVVRTRVQAGDILLSITAYIGSVAVVPEGFEEAYVSQHVARCTLKDASHNPRWLGYVLLSEIGQTHGKLSLYGGTKDGLSLDDVKNYPLFLPPRSEQDHLVLEIEQCVGDIDTAITRTNREIELHKEYQTRLIADVVTGKLNVREAALNFPEEPDEPGSLSGPEELLDEIDVLTEDMDVSPAESGA